MDFIVGLPNSHGYTVIMVIVDKLSKYAHFLPLSHPLTAIQVARLYFDQVYRLHGLPQAIISDRDKKFHKYTVANSVQTVTYNTLELCVSPTERWTNPAAQPMFGDFSTLSG